MSEQQLTCLYAACSNWCEPTTGRRLHAAVLLLLLCPGPSCLCLSWQENKMSEPLLGPSTSLEHAQTLQLHRVLFWARFQLHHAAWLSLNTKFKGSHTEYVAKLDRSSSLQV